MVSFLIFGFTTNPNKSAVQSLVGFTTMLVFISNHDLKYLCTQQQFVYLFPSIQKKNQFDVDLTQCTMSSQQRFVFNLEYLSQFILKYLNEGQYQNCHEEQISKLSPIFLFCRKLTEIFKVKDNARNQKRYHYFFVWVYWHLRHSAPWRHRVI